MDGVMIGKRECGAASLELRETTAVPEDMRYGIREVTNLVTDEAKRRQGYADALMHTVCYEADKQNMVLLLNAESAGEMSTTKLIKFYKKHGFIELPRKSDTPILMARQVNG